MLMIYCCLLDTAQIYTPVHNKRNSVPRPCTAELLGLSSHRAVVSVLGEA